MLAEYEGQLSIRLVLFGWNSRLHDTYSFPPLCSVSFHHKIMLGIFIRILQTCAVFLDNACLYCFSFTSSLCLLYLIVFPASHPPLTFLLQSISVLPSCDKRGSKVPATDQILGNEDASSACPPARDFDGDWPSRWAGRSTSLS